jgi:hypothetical protein
MAEAFGVAGLDRAAQRRALPGEAGKKAEAAYQRAFGCWAAAGKRIAPTPPSPPSPPNRGRRPVRALRGARPLSRAYSSVGCQGMD